MMLIPPSPADLAFTGSSPTYVTSAWVTATAYAKDAKVRYQVASVWYDYTCIRAHTSSASRTPTSTYYWWKTGLSATTGGYTYTSNVRLSNYATWTSGAAVAAWSTYFDEADHHDYLAPRAISAGDNTLRPSVAVTSATEAVAARWVDAGAANAWAPFDSLSNSYLQGYDSSGALVDPAWTLTLAVTSAAVNQLFLSGLVGVKTVAAVVTLSGGDGSVTLVQPTSVNLETGTFGVTRRNAILPLTYIPPGVGYTLSIAITLTRLNTNFPAQCAICGVGYGYEIANTEWGLETSILDFSRKERDETYGTVNFIKRGAARVLRATCLIDPAIVSGDVAQYILQDHTGKPLMLDFNNTGSSYDRLKIFGFYTNLRVLVSAASYEILSIDVEGLVE